MKKNKFLVLFIVLVLNSVIALGQNASNDKTLIVSNFAKAVFFEKTTPKAIAEKYILFRPADNPTASIDERIKMLGKHLKNIKKEKIPLIDPSQYSVVSYNSLQDDKVKFSKNTDDIYVLVSKDKPVLYVYMENEKILSFDYFLKTGDGYFILY